MRKETHVDERLYCMYTGEHCIHCNKCEHIPQYTIINNMPKSNNWASKLIIVLLIIFIIYLLIMLAPYLMTNLSNNLMTQPTYNSGSSPIYLSNYEPQNSYGGSEVQNYYNNPVSSTSSSELPAGYVINTSGEAYNPMG